MEKTTTKIILFEDNHDYRETLQMILNSEKGLEVIAAYPDPTQIVKIINTQKPDLLVMDIDMPTMNGIEAIRKVRAQKLDTLIMIMTNFGREEYIFDAMKVGANGYLLKTSSVDEILAGIHTVLQGGSPMSPQVARMVFDFFHKEQKASEEENNLSRREKEILRSLVDGNSYKMIAAELYISIDTVRSHLRKIYEKLQVHSKSEAVVMALKKKIV